MFLIIVYLLLFITKIQLYDALTVMMKFLKKLFTIFINLTESKLINVNRLRGTITDVNLLKKN